MNKNSISLCAAPLQGYTEAIWRHAHAAIYGLADHIEYFTPFIRVEKGQVRGRDLRDAAMTCNDGLSLVPQAIFRDVAELRMIVDALVAAGYRHVNLNLGCPFPPQCHKGRGAAMVGNANVMTEVCEYVNGCHEVDFSIKMRLGMDTPDEWRKLMPVLNKTRLRYVIVHPRIGRQQYSGGLHLDEFALLLSESEHPVVFNGDICLPEDINIIVERFPRLYGVMAGRGLQSRPSLFNEWFESAEWPRSRRLDGIMRMHEIIYAYYCRTLCGEAQILSKIRPFWTYLELEIGRKSWKLISKSSTLARYSDSVAEIRLD